MILTTTTLVPQYCPDDFYDLQDAVLAVLESDDIISCNQHYDSTLEVLVVHFELPEELQAIVLLHFWDYQWKIFNCNQTDYTND